MIYTYEYSDKSSDDGKAVEIPKQAPVINILDKKSEYIGKKPEKKNSSISSRSQMFMDMELESQILKRRINDKPPLPLASAKGLSPSSAKHDGALYGLQDVGIRNSSVRGGTVTKPRNTIKDKSILASNLAKQNSSSFSAIKSTIAEQKNKNVLAV